MDRGAWQATAHKVTKRWTQLSNLACRKSREREKGPEEMPEEIIAENFPNMGKEIVNQVQETQRIPGRINPRRNTLRHIVIKLMKTKDKDEILKATREK